MSRVSYSTFFPILMKRGPPPVVRKLRPPVSIGCSVPADKRMSEVFWRLAPFEINPDGKFAMAMRDDELERVLVQRLAALGLSVEVIPESDTQH